MPRMSDWQQEAHDAVRKENWSLRGPNQVVKVVPGENNTVSRVAGYIALGRFLLGKTPQQIEKDLGLPDGKIRQVDGPHLWHETRSL
jgi:hypothetical protein